MQRSESVTTMPSSRLYRAPTGQTFTHGASSQCMHGRGMNQTLVPGNSPSSKRNTYIQKEASVVLFSTLQASMHARQPVHLSRSTTIPYLGIFVTSSLRGFDLHLDVERLVGCVGHVSLPGEEQGV